MDRCTICGFCCVNPDCGGKRAFSEDEAFNLPFYSNPHLWSWAQGMKSWRQVGEMSFLCQLFELTLTDKFSKGGSVIWLVLISSALYSTLSINPSSNTEYIWIWMGLKEGPGGSPWKPYYFLLTTYSCLKMMDEGWQSWHHSGIGGNVSTSTSNN